MRRLILLRLRFPTSLLRAALVCRQWYLAVSSAGFLEEFQRLHPPVLIGYFAGFDQDPPPQEFVPFPQIPPPELASVVKFIRESFLVGWTPKRRERPRCVIYSVGDDAAFVFLGVLADEGLYYLDLKNLALELVGSMDGMINNAIIPVMMVWSAVFPALRSLFVPSAAVSSSPVCGRLLVLGGPGPGCTLSKQQ
uniref:F-box protein AT5G49610-like beta-propeller domain-containing protein n=1 Tax=Oryza brachyantha TaxID=4533 RepID=J3LTB4_ORYBR